MNQPPLTYDTVYGISDILEMMRPHREDARIGEAIEWLAALVHTANTEGTLAALRSLTA